ncbi:putative thiamine pyrophosphate-containing protein YdaP [Micromonospora sp. MW-13]|uniref:thiamine pyrophosphate-binding protein n=1 Tax=unclassified Micromonospora TaxID=2617518 RepID=UPI000E43397C|nr:MULTISPECIES: thiamine pyrophosphate-binding protein [unclassified Micromonospora]MCX4472815.1 thiamine pyrophosphate-binding protein [Micromonospora sp. NBC_01655]RGC69522.1 putative thiamine pyrophosphate-containing protein YdaP [Micromonospora sp. MW-13]
MVDRTVADLVVERLRAWRVPRAFGCPGPAIAPVVAALDRAGGDPQFVPARHEETASFMASGHAKFTGELGVCLATQGPSAVHLLNGLYDAKLDSKPVVAIVGEDITGPLGGAHEEIGLSRLFGDVCNQFVRYGRTPEQVPAVLDQAFRTAAATRSPTCVVLPLAVQLALVPDRLPQVTGVTSATPGEPLARVLPHDADLAAAASLLGAGNRVAILVGQGGHGAAREIVALADRLGAGVATSLLGKPVLDERLPFHTGVLGEVGTSAAAQLMGGCDTLLMVGTNDPWTDYYPVQTRTIQIDIDGRRIGTRYPVDVPLVGDAAETLRVLLDRVPVRPRRDWRRTVERSVDRWREEAAARTEEPGEPVNPQLVLHQLSVRMPRSAAVSVDVGSVIYWYARHLELPPGVTAQLCGTLGSTGCALPYAVAAKLARPDRPVIALAGDGAMQLNGLAELITVAHHWREWADPRLVVLVLNNRDHSGTGGGQAPTGASARRPDVPYAGWARLLGLHGVRVDRPELVGAAWDEALAADRPSVLEAVVDPTVPLRPPEPALADLRGLVADGDAARLVRERLLARRVAVEADGLG